MHRRHLPPYCCSSSSPPFAAISPPAALGSGTGLGPDPDPGSGTGIGPGLCTGLGLGLWGLTLVLILGSDLRLCPPADFRQLFVPFLQKALDFCSYIVYNYTCYHIDAAQRHANHAIYTPPRRASAVGMRPTRGSCTVRQQIEYAR